MRKEILEQISSLEKEQDIKILLAVESGSRAWGCPSPNSDYDVRILFHRKQSDYLEIDDKPDNIDYFHGELLDINGWDIKKALKLIRKSNVTPFEWAQSPITYKEVDNFSQKILELCRQYFNPYHSVNHYRGIAKNTFLKMPDQGEVNLKKMFYILRPIMAAKWIATKQEVPPMDIPKLITIIDDKEVVNKINELLLIKKDANEDFTLEVDSLLFSYIKSEMAFLENVNLESSNKTQDSTPLNLAFKEIINT